MFTIHEEYQLEKEAKDSELNQTKEETKMEISIEKVGKSLKKIDFSWNKEDDVVMEQVDNEQKQDLSNMDNAAQSYDNYNGEAPNEIEDSAKSQSDQVNSDNDEGIIDLFINIDDHSDSELADKMPDIVDNSSDEN